MSPTGGPGAAGTGGEAGGGAGPGDGDAAGLPNLLVRAGQVFVAPGRLFGRLRDRPAWAGALALAVAVAVAATLLVPEELFREFMLSQMPADAPADAVQSQVDAQVRFRWVPPLVGMPLGAAITAGILLFIYNLLLGGEGRYRQLVAVSSHALLIPAVGEMVTVPLRIQTQSFETSLALHLLAPGLEEGFLLFFLQGLNVFALWASVVIGVGVSRVYPRSSAGSASAVVVGLFLALAAGGAALRAAFAG
jgi:hypothetical protein